MGIVFDKVTTARGKEIQRSLTSGQVNADEVRGFLAKVSKDGELVGKPLMSVIESDTSYSPEARMLVRGFDLNSAEGSASALVVKSAAQRIVLGFMLRMNMNAGNDNMKVFGKEADALKWLDEKLEKLPKK